MAVSPRRSDAHVLGALLHSPAEPVQDRCAAAVLAQQLHLPIA